LRLISEFLGGYRDVSLAEISGLLSSYGGKITSETESFLFFSTDQPDKIASRVAFSKRIGRIIEDGEEIELSSNRTYAIREKRGSGNKSLIESVAGRIRGKVDLDSPDVVFYVYNSNEPIITEVIHERRMNELVDHRYKTKPMNHPSSITPILARGMINMAGLKEGERFIDPFTGTGTYLIEGYRMGIESLGIDRSWKMVEGGNKNLRHFGFPENIRQGDFSELVSEDNFSAIVTDPPYGRGAKIFSQSRDSLYSRFFSLISGCPGTKVFCLPSVELNALAKEFISVEMVGKIRVHNSLTRYILLSR
jgi:tRNA (guanine10-N2)-dimethyltransferase